MVRTGRISEPLDSYGHPITTDDVIVFSWSGDLHKGIVLSVKPVKAGRFILRHKMEVIPFDANGNKIDHIVKVKDTRSTVKI